MRNLTVLLVLGILVLLLGSVAGRQEVATPEEEVMWRKLDLAHDALDALALDDFEALQAYAEDLITLGEAGSWLESDSEDYRAESEQFLRAAGELEAAARLRDSDAAAFAYLDLTLRCIQCHRRLGKLPPE